MASFNKVILLGNLTRNVELKFAQGGLAIAKFGMALNRVSGSGNDKKEKVCFVDLTAFGKQAENLEKYVRKGSQLHVEGRLDYSTWEAKDGSGKRNKLEIIVETFQFIGAPIAKDGSDEKAETKPNYEDQPF